MNSLIARTLRACAAAALLVVAPEAVFAAGPHYVIVDLGVVGAGTASQALGVSPEGTTAVGRELSGAGNPALAWTRSGGVALPSLAGHAYSQANGVNDAGTIVGTATTSAFGVGAVPVVWSGGTVTPLTLPEGQAVGRANAINASGVAVGSVGSDLHEYAAIYDGMTTHVISATTASGQYMAYANGINDAGLVVGGGLDPHDAAVTVALAHDITTGTMVDLGCLPGDNGGIAYAVSKAGHVVGTSTFNGYPDKPFIWTAAGGMVAIPLPPHTSLGTARAVNENGWVVGNAGGLYSVPFLHAGGRTYPLHDLLPANSGWDLKTNTSSSATGISRDGTIVGTGVHGGKTHAYAMYLVRANDATRP